MTPAGVTRRDAIIGYASAFAAAACYGSLAVIGRHIVHDGIAPPLVANAFATVLGTIVLAAIFQGHIRADYKLRPPWQGWLFVSLAGVASTWGVTFWFLALNEAPAVLVAPLSSIYPLFSVLMALVFLRGVERVTLRTVIGAALIVAGVALVTIGME